jgi:Na+-translocating ferredoxin:NAD+ oxidoreductase RNF subunit RnfB
MAVAIRKLAELDAETKALPGKDCGVCGAPTCAALAEDIVMGRAVRALCPYVTPEEGSAS